MQVPQRKVRKKRVIINPIYKDNTLDFIEEDPDRYVNKERTNDRNQLGLDNKKTQKEVIKDQPIHILYAVVCIAFWVGIAYAIDAATNS